MNASSCIAVALLLGGCSSPGPGNPPSRSADTLMVPDDTSATGSSEWKIVPGRSAGALTAATSEADLRQHYGSDQVRSVRVEIGEGETIPGTALFPEDSSRRMEIIWQDTVGRRRP